MASTWKTVRVFLASTFRDMHAERDHLVKVTFPHLRQWCAERRLHLVDVDLRWGVTRQQTDHGRALGICLNEIDTCRPFFLCLLGNRYGWIPGPGGVPAEALQQFGGLRSRLHCSITHLELIHAVEEPLNSDLPPPPCSQAFFYFRKPECLPAPQTLQALGDEERRVYAETFFESDPPPRQLVEGIKTRLRERFQPEGRVFEYGGVWDSVAVNPEDDALRGRLTHLEAFGERVEADLKRAVLAEFAEHVAALDRRDPLAEERSFHEAFVEARTRVHVPRATVEEQITQHVEGDDPRPLVLSGPPGSGKSAVLAHWAKHYRSAALLLARFIGASPASTNLTRLLANLAEELVAHFGLTEEVEGADGGAGQTQRRPLEVPADPLELQQKWPRILEAAGVKGHVVVLLDALEQLDLSADPLRLTWLPSRLPAGVRLVLSVLDQGERTGHAGAQPPDWLTQLRRLEVSEVPVPALTDDDRRRIVRELPSVFCKTLDDEQVTRLLQNDATRNALFLTVALEELRLFGSFEKLPAAIAALPRLDDPDIGGDIDRALDRLFGRVLDRLERETDGRAPGLVAVLFRLLAASREGLSEEELEGVLARALPGLPAATRSGMLQTVLRQVRPYLMRKGLRQGVLVDFYHRSFWKAACSRYLADPAQREESHRELAAYFQEQPSYRSPHPSGPIPPQGAERGERQPRPSASFPPLVGEGLGGLTPNRRKLVELPWQLVQAGREAGPAPLSERKPAWQILEELLCDLSFLEAKAEAGLLFELIGDFAAVAAHRPADAPALLQLLEEALRTDVQFLARHPDAVFQCLWNRAWWYDCPDSARYYECELPVASPLAALLESWRTHKEQTSPGFRWLRLLRPPEVPLGSAQQAVFRGHEDAVTSLAFAPDGGRVATGSLDKTVRVWDVRSGGELLALSGHEAAVLGVLFTPDGRRLLSVAADQALHVWDAATGAGLARVHGPGTKASCAAFAPDGSRVVTAAGRVARVWATNDGTELACLHGHHRAISSLAFAAAGGRVVSGGEDDTIRVWEAATGNELLHFRGHADTVWSVALAPDGRTIASAGGKMVRVWDARTGAEQIPLRGHERSVMCVAFAADGRLVSGGSMVDNSVRVWGGDGREQARYRGHASEVRCVAVSPDGRWIASGGGMFDNTARLWDARAGGVRVRLRGGHQAALKSVAFSPDGRLVASGGGMFDNNVLLWDARDGCERATLRGHKADVGCLAFAPPGRLLASGSRDGTVRLWDVEACGAVACLRGHLSEVRGVAFSPNGLRVASGGQDRTLRLWDVTTPRQQQVVRTEAEVWSVAFAADGQRLAGGAYDGSVYIWDQTGIELARLHGHEGTVGAVAFSPDGNRLVSFGVRDHTLRTWDLAAGVCVGEVAGVDGLADIAPFAAGPPRFPWRAVVRGQETLIESATTGLAVARLPLVLARLAVHPSGRAWAGVDASHLYFAERTYLCLVALEGAPQDARTV
jgi:WD40 repeat protein